MTRYKDDKMIEIDVKPYETFALHDLANMFPFNITPALIESKIAHSVAAKQRMFNSLTPQMMMMVVTVMIGGVIAAVIAWKFIGGGQQEVRIVLDQAALQLAPGAIQRNLTG